MGREDRIGSLCAVHSAQAGYVGNLLVLCSEKRQGSKKALENEEVL